jgi:hypothetical protein
MVIDSTSWAGAWLPFREATSCGGADDAPADGFGRLINNDLGPGE